MQTPIEPSLVKDRTEEQLLAEIDDLKRKLREQHRDAHHGGTHGHPKRPSSTTLWMLGIGVLVIIVVAFFAGYLPETSRQTALAKEAQADASELPPVNVSLVEHASGKSMLLLPGNIQAVTEAPVLARASGYIKQRYADIGDRVKQGQLLAEIDAAEVDKQVEQAKATVQQAKSSLDQANANLSQSKTNAEMARVTFQRWDALVAKGAVSRQDADTYKSQAEALGQNVQSLQNAVEAARSNIAVAQANLDRLTQVQGYLKVRAPFDGVITLRNVDTGALVTEGSTMLFRIAQNGKVRTYVNVPQADATSIHVGQTAQVKLPDMPSKTFPGIVTRTANALDPATRTLLTEIQVPNAQGLLLPGMYAEVNFSTPRQEPPLLIRADALVVRGDGNHVALVDKDGIVHFKAVLVGRDYGDQLEILGGLEMGDQVVVSPGDTVRENAKVRAILIKATKS
jgi:RND family efflux transporter MFP subunit